MFWESQACERGAWRRTSARAAFLLVPSQSNWSSFVFLSFISYASVYFVTLIDAMDNPLLALEQIHRFCVLLDAYFGRVSELDLIFNFDRAYLLLDQYLLDGKMVESSLTQVITHIKEDDVVQAAEVMEDALAESLG